MAIPVSSVVDVSIAIGATFPARAGFGTLNVVTAETGVLDESDRIRSYSTVDEVISDWGTSSEVSKVATAYFGQQPKPTKFKVSYRQGSGTAAELIGGTVLESEVNNIRLINDGRFITSIDGGLSTETGDIDFTSIPVSESAVLTSGILDSNDLSTLLSINDGEFSISIDGSPLTPITGIDTSGDATIVEAAATIQDRVQIHFPTAAVTNFGNAIVITSGTQGVASAMTYGDTVSGGGGGTDISSTIRITSVLAASLTQGSGGSMADVVTLIQPELDIIASGTTITYNSSEMRFEVVSPTLGVGSDVEFFSSPVGGTDISGTLGLDSGNATKVAANPIESLTNALSAIEDVDSDWYGLMFTKEVRDDADFDGETVVDVALWCEARIKVFFNTTNDLEVLDITVDIDVASVLASNNLRRTMTTYSSYPDQYPSASIAGRAFTVNFNQPNSTITLKFKQMPGITQEDISSSQKAVLDSKLANALIVVGASDMYAESFMASGVFFDEVHGIDWLQDAIQTNVFGYLLTRTTKVPYTDKGVAALEQQVISALDEAVRNGLIAPGETIDGEFLGNGYKTTTIPVADINQSDVEARHYPGLSFTVIGAGAIHSVQINGVFER